ncbi:cupin domain-containing protein [Tabrizicola sp.]|uniref:cupin domain-containing protein n=1 Tax=Tabrizicola sp. TaxID=2005166 RepID=UPI003F323C1C
MIMIKMNAWTAGMLAGAICAGALMPLQAFAGECPADQVAEGARTTGETTAKDVTDTVISTIDLSSKGEAFKGYMLRMRRLEIAPGGIVPWHSHEVRAANILVLEGTIIEYRSTCKVGIEHKAGDVVGEFGADLAHWWKNESDKPVVIISSDLLPPEMPKPETM